MDMYNLEKKVNDAGGFLKIIIDAYNEDGISKALALVKKSGICVDFFGTGKPRKTKLFKMTIDELKKLESNTNNNIIKFEKEVILLNRLYKDFIENHLKEIEKLVPDEKHIISYLLALELFLSNDINKLKGNSGLNNNRSDIFENVTISAGSVLKYLINYRHFPLRSASEKVDVDFVRKASKHFESSAVKNILDILLELWSYFEVDIEESEFITATSKGDKALGKIISHMKFMDVRNAKMARYAHQQFIIYGKGSTNVSTRKLPPLGYISYNERMACEFVEEYFSCNKLDIRFLDISISEFIRGYSIIANESEKFLKKRRLQAKYNDMSIQDICITKTKRKWIYLFVEMGIPKNSAQKIFDLLVFDKTSNDLFDCPLVEIDEEYIVLPSISSVTDPSRALLSNLKNREVDIKIKGTLFEIQLRDTLSKAGIKSIQLNKPDYECDIVFAIENDIFFVESKHFNDPTSYREYRRNLDEIENACLQLDRIAEYYSREENLDAIKRKLELSSINSIYKIVVTNTSSGEKLQFNNTFVIDEVNFSGYFLRKPPLIHDTKKNIVISI